MSRIVFHHRVEISDGKGIIKHSDGFVVAEEVIVAESEKEIVVSINHGRFVVIEKSRPKYKIGPVLGCEDIGFSVNDHCFGNRIHYTLFDTVRRPAGQIRAEIELVIKSKFGFFTDVIDLSIIREAE